MNFLSGIISAVLSLVIAVILGFFLLIALNGFSGKAGEYAIYFYVVWGIAIAIILGIGSFLAAKYLGKTSWHKAFVVLLPIIVSLILSGVGNFIGMIVAGIMADSMWKK
ncbi:MAG: hypothetical protein K1X72_01865 [Pyrinomonadaceae bacterium]|nr:hypothetical protein [Pyrinomonadaceae bacterium]